MRRRSYTTVLRETNTSGTCGRRRGRVPLAPVLRRPTACLLLLLFSCQREKSDPALDALPTSLSETAVKAADALADNACKGMRACTYDGQCTLVKGRCRAKSDADCQSSLSCTDWGTCHADAGDCVAREDKHCQKAWTCLNMGRCTARDDKCVVDDDGDCGRSELCKVQRKCKADQGRCIKSS